MGRTKELGNKKGQTLVEFALVVTLLLALLFGITEFGRGWYYSNALTNGARDGARYASTLKLDANYETKVENYTFSQITSAIPGNKLQTVSVSAFAPNGSARSGPLGTTYPQKGDAVEVTVSYELDILTGSIIPFFSGQRQLVRSATMYYEGS